MARGDHIYVHCDLVGIGSYTHHGIDCGDGTVIHYSEGIICRTTIQQFSQGKEICRSPYEYCDSPNLVMIRAKSRLGECNYDLIFNNCEHFATWCKTGHEESKQVKPLLDVLDFFKWRMEVKERQSYQNLIDRQNEILRKLNHEFRQNDLRQTKDMVPQMLQERSLVTDNFDYRILEILLKEGCWQEADELTAYAMLKVSNRDYERYFRLIDIANFPREDLLIIDKLWLEYSRNLFGFSVQKKIYQSLGGIQDYQYEIWENFSNKVGWRKNDIPLLYEQLCFGIHAPKGHFPHGKKIGFEVIGLLAII
ncbi:MAG: GUN4 domain-containing protein [Chlorogloeopsis fritschii C42_A2020_084]|uniref:GUN4 domain-containing protein n=1 Tax=Chlorogloeopsis fritschii TaxID=1124 RepID=UPI001A07F98B|nr:GUN4 domain-containing protein [Chlorogloeopsis fritschii]MBF2008474.1 GUN4 domain-containing protein [Chlorogloeopsis fritschii C42_A2020_084]